MGLAIRIADVTVNTVSMLLVEIGEACAVYHDEHPVSVPDKYLVRRDAVFPLCQKEECIGGEGRDTGSGWCLCLDGIGT